MPLTANSSPRKWRRGFRSCGTVCSWTLKTLGVLLIILFIITGMMGPNNEELPHYPRGREPRRTYSPPAPRTTYYDILKVSPGVSDRALKLSYRKLIKQHHPDKLPANLTAPERKTHGDRYQRVLKAYEILSGPRRCQYALDHGVDQETVLDCCRVVLAKQVADYNKSTEAVAISDLRRRSVYSLGWALESLPGFSELLVEYWPNPGEKPDRGDQTELTALIKSYPREVISKVTATFVWTCKVFFAIPDTFWSFGRWVFRR
ncbi:hypothetical protein F5Y18DRAFT_435382 [Xylariaceae sp. FL1019]|nr:hypothetical protein F5Y18DRAFT_435382 [Xylariaceae sp. FL1019]